MTPDDVQKDRFTSYVLDASDGSGDGMLELPDELLARMGWKEGDVLTVSFTDTGSLLVKRDDN